MKASTRVASDGSLRVLHSDVSSLNFEEVLKRSCGPLLRGPVSTLQINVGKRCNQACHHCHVDAGPKRTEVMNAGVAERLLRLLAVTPAIATVDITGGAPELNPNFRRLVTRSRELGREVIDRCNLTVLFEPEMAGLGEFLAEKKVQIVASLPCYTAGNVDAQRGRGVFEKSIRALQRLNGLGYGKPGSALTLNLVYNPLGATLPPEQSRLEADYKHQLRANFGIEFHQLFTLANMPISRFADQLRRSGNYQEYMALLAGNFNTATVAGLMCRSLISVGWDGALYDCDFNQMLGVGLSGRRVTVWDLESLGHMEGQRIATGTHCFGCTAGAGSSCGGALQ
ncbi:MAG: arsenosugar biosynthesis radical SAM (seleno)protein ArsS [Terriglobia bacterium]